jgi:hypothetical protein
MMPTSVCELERGLSAVRAGFCRRGALAAQLSSVHRRKPTQTIKGIGRTEVPAQVFALIRPFRNGLKV